MFTLLSESFFLAGVQLKVIFSAYHGSSYGIFLFSFASLQLPAGWLKFQTCLSVWFL